MEDGQIVGLFWARSEEALRAVDETYGGLCRSLALNILNDRQDAEECVNDAYLGLWRAIPPARPAPLRTYLCRVVRNIALNAYYKKRAARRSAAGCVPFEELKECLAGADDAVQALETKKLTRCIERFLDTLSRETGSSFCAATGSRTAAARSPGGWAFRKRTSRCALRACAGS